MQKKKKKKNQNYPAIRRANQWNDYLYASDLRQESCNLIDRQSSPNTPAQKGNLSFSFL